jgi:signal transduction histidine kinase
MNIQRRACLAFFNGALLLSACALAGAAGPGPADARRLVEKGVAYAKANGRDKLIAAVNVKDGEFHAGSLYMTIFDMGGTLLAIPTNPKLVGKNLIDVPDPDGKLFRRDFIDTASSHPAGGWVDYKYKNPATGKVEAKTTFVMKVGDVVLAAGIYK